MATLITKAAAVAIAIRRQKFERNGRGSVFDPSMITHEEIAEAEAAIKAADAWDKSFYNDPLDDDYDERRYF